MSKISINMLSSADKVAGQGVGSAYLEQVSLVRDGASDLFDIYINSHKKCDIVHVHTVDLWNYFKMRKGVSVCYVHFLPDTLDGSIKLPKFAFNVFKKYVTKFYNKADHLVVVNPIFIDDLVKFGIDRKKITYIPNYVSRDKFYKKDASDIRKKYNISDDAFVVLGVGQVQTRKGVVDFIDVANKMPDTTFVWCGGFSFGRITDGYEELKNIYENPPKNVIFTGIVPREEMNDMYNMADVLFMPSYNELFPMSILEAINSSKPLLLRDLDLYRDILFEKYLKGNNNDEFVSKLNDLKNDKKIYSKYSKLSNEISEFYSKEHVLEIWKEFYQSIVK
ncbi:MAG: glycosyltransferase family 4 protein [Bacilli bacterium]